MHELSIAMSIVEMAEEEAELRGNVHIQAVHLRLGLLSGVVKEALLSSYEIACETTALEGSRLIIEEIPVEIYCSNCRTHRPVHSIQRFCCAECGTPSAEVNRGKELEVFALEIRE
jgi:hydrogenase nickel incorporation protein HypA/HybF